MSRTVFNYSLAGGRTKFPVNFEYLARRFVTVTLVGETSLPLVLNVDFRFISKTEIETTVPRESGAFQTIEVRRVTSSTDRLVNFTDGSILRSQDLNVSQIQAIHIAEEGRDVSDNAILNNGIRWNALGLPILNMADPVSPMDAVNLRALLDKLERTLRVADGKSLTELPDVRANKLLGFDSNGNPVALIPSAGSSLELELKLKDPTDGAHLSAYRNSGLAGVEGVHDVTLQEKGEMDVSLYEFGLKRGDVDNSQALHDGLKWLYGGNDRKLIIPSGLSIQAPQKVDIQFEGLVRNCHLEAYGSTIYFGDNGGIKIEAGVKALLSETSIKGLRTNGGVDAFELLAGDQLNFIYNATLQDLDIANFSRSGLVASGNIFETSLRDYSAGSLKSTGYCLHLRNVGTGIISSFDIFGGNTRGGKHGLFADAPVSDLRVYGGTYLMALNEGIRIDNSIGTSINGTHVEMNWRGATRMSEGGAGLHLSGRGSINDVVGVNSSDTFQRYVVSVYATDVVIKAGGKQGTIEKYGKYQQSPTGSLTLLGVGPSDFDSVGTVKPALISGALVKTVRSSRTENLITMSAVIAPDLTLGNFIRLRSPINKDVTVSNPIGASGHTGEEFIVEIEQDTTGGFKVVWGDSFGSGLTPIDPLRFKVSRWSFIKSGGKWRQVSFSSTF